MSFTEISRERTLHLEIKMDDREIQMNEKMNYFSAKIDAFIYIANPAGGILNHNRTEIEKMCWFTLEETQQLKLHDEIFLDTQKTIQKLLLDHDL